MTYIEQQPKRWLSKSFHSNIPITATAEAFFPHKVAIPHILLRLKTSSRFNLTRSTISLAQHFSLCSNSISNGCQSPGQKIHLYVMSCHANPYATHLDEVGRYIFGIGSDSGYGKAQITAKSISSATWTTHRDTKVANPWQFFAVSCERKDALSFFFALQRLKPHRGSFENNNSV